MVKTYTLDEFKAIQREQKHPHLGLYQIDGVRVVAFNPNGGVKPAEKLKEIERMLNNPSLPDGVYLIKGKASLHPNGVTFDYPIIKGNPEEISVEQLNDNAKENNDKPFEQFDPSVTSFQNVLELRVENEKLKLENDQLKAENDQLREDIDELENENAGLLSENAPHWSESLKEMGENLITMFSPTIDKHYELKERQIKLQEMQLSARPQQITQPQQTPTQENYQKTGVDYTNKRITEYIAQFEETDPDKCKAFIQIYNQAESLDNFFEIFREQMGEENFVELVNFINNDQQ